MKVKEEINKLSEFMDAVVAGKVKSVRYYPAEEFEKVKNWIKTVSGELEGKPKYEELPIAVQQVK